MWDLVAAACGMVVIQNRLNKETDLSRLKCFVMIYHGRISNTCIVKTDSLVCIEHVVELPLLSQVADKYL